jgi:molybdopterin-biosynthesis enzyme MoeA-like protein
VIVTGGLGPTVDDPTREAAAYAFQVELEYHPELWEKIRQRYPSRAGIPSENNQKQAFIPAGAQVIENPVGTAPGFILRKSDKSLICLPGVPREMETLMQTSVIPFLVSTYALKGLIKVKVLHVSGMPESRVDQVVADFETWQNPTVGLLAHPGIVDIRLTAKADSPAEADVMIACLEKPIRERFGKDIFGEDGTTLYDHVKMLLAEISQEFVFIETGPAPVLEPLLRNLPMVKQVKYSPEVLSLESLSAKAAEVFARQKEGIVFFFTHWKEGAAIKCVSGIISSNKTNQVEKEYRGPAANGELWVMNTALDFVRRNLV